MSRNLARTLGIIALVVAVGLALTYRDLLDADALTAWVNDAGAAGPVLFIGLYAIATVLFLPGMVMTLAGGALFGPVWGTLYNLLGATLGAGLAFLVARHLAWQKSKKGVRSLFHQRKRDLTPFLPFFARLMQAVEAEGWRFVAFTRLVPLFPFNLLNYALGLTRIGFLPYLLATLVFMLPGALAYTYLGFAGREAMAGGDDLIQKGLIALALLAAVAFLPRLVARLRRKPMLPVTELKARLDAGQELLLLDVRTAEDFVGEQGHIPGATNIPLEVLGDRLEEVGTDLERPIALVCRTDRRSAKAAALLTRRGYGEVHVIQGGMTAWLAQGWPVEDAHRKPET
jgi:uncharacterized membrane protein YdjX (TVP38/TMEM64 family)